MSDCIFHNPNQELYCSKGCNCGRTRAYMRGQMFKYLECGVKNRYDVKVNKDWKVVGGIGTYICADPEVYDDNDKMESAMLNNKIATLKIKKSLRQMNVDFDITDYKPVRRGPCGHNILNNHFIANPNTNQVCCIGSECVKHFQNNSGVEQVKCYKCNKGHNSKDIFSLCSKCGKYIREGWALAQKKTEMIKTEDRFQSVRKKQIKELKLFLKESIHEYSHLTIVNFIAYVVYIRVVRLNCLKPEGIIKHCVNAFNKIK